MSLLRSPAATFFGSDYSTLLLVRESIYMWALLELARFIHWCLIPRPRLLGQELTKLCDSALQPTVLPVSCRPGIPLSAEQPVA